MAKRLFFALPITFGLYPKISNLEKEISKKLKVNWIPLENLHLTILFLGYLKENDVFLLDKVIDLLQTNYSQYLKKLHLKINKIDYGPPNKKRMIWLYIDKNQDLDNLRNLIISRLVEAGINFKREERDFLPHINLVRLKFKSEKLPNIEKRLEWGVIFNRLNLYESYLEKPFARYEILKSIKLNS
jgi:2'-5' RNA ligase